MMNAKVMTQSGSEARRTFIFCDISTRLSDSLIAAVSFGRQEQKSGGKVCYVPSNLNQVDGLSFRVTSGRDRRNGSRGVERRDGKWRGEQESTRVRRTESDSIVDRGREELEGRVRRGRRVNIGRWNEEQRSREGVAPETLTVDVDLELNAKWDVRKGEKKYVKGIKRRAKSLTWEMSEI